MYESRKYWLLLLVSLLMGGAYALTLEEVDSRFEEEAEKVLAGKEERFDGLKRSYLGALLRYERQARQERNLDGVLAVQREIERVEEAESPRPLNTSGDVELARLQGVVIEQVDEIEREHAEEMMELTDNLERYARRQTMELTEQGQINEAKRWRDWGEGLRSREDVRWASGILQGERRRNERESAESRVNRHPAFRRSAIEIREAQGEDFASSPRAYVKGKEPEGSESRVSDSTPSAAGSGHTLLRGNLRLVDEDETISRHRSRFSRSDHQAHLYVPRAELTPLPGQTLGRTLLVFDLYKRGTGSRRELIRTDRVVLPPIEEGNSVVVDAGLYAYESSRYRSRISRYRSERTTADEFYGYIVSLFDEEGNLLFQRATDRALHSHARSAPPAS